MYKGITPTIVLSLPESSAVLNATNVYVTLADKCKSITKTNDELAIEADIKTLFDGSTNYFYGGNV